MYGSGLKMAPEAWYSKIKSLLEKNRVKVKVKLIQIRKSRTRWLLDRYNIILNPYGSSYPEIDIKELTIWKSILHYVLNGGTFVNVADIPFYWAYDPKREIKYEMVKYFHQYVPIYERVNEILHPIAGRIISFGPYPQSPFLAELKINIISTERLEGREIVPLSCLLRLKENVGELEDLGVVAINRGVVVGRVRENEKKIEASHVKSVVEEVEWERYLVTPLCYIDFGKGRFLISLLFLGYDKQSEETKEKVTGLLCNLVVKEISQMK